MIAATKLHIPHVRHALVDRSSLLRLLDEGMDAKLTHVFAPSGYGKTTVLCEWAKQSGKVVAWVSLGSQDDDWSTFWSLVIASIQRHVADFGQTVAPQLTEGPSASFESTEPAMTALLNEFSQLTEELIIILDDYHLMTMQAIHKSMYYLLDYLPVHIHFYIATRNDLPFASARFYARGQLRRITIEQLRFQPEEVYDFFRETTNLKLSVDQLNMLHKQTEGWISGLRLAALSLKQSRDVSASIRQFSGHQQHISDYLLEEVIRDLPAGLYDFLLQTSVLSQMNYALCEAVTGQAGGQQLLELLEQLQLFIIPLDDHRSWYRYHHLLSDFLQSTLTRTAPELWVQANRRAAEWLENHGFIVDAVEHYLAGNQYEDVARMIEKHLYELLGGKNTVVSRWVMQVPEPYVASRPFVELFCLLVKVGTRQFDGIQERVERLRLLVEAMKEHMDQGVWHALMGDIYYIYGVAAYVRRDLAGTADYFILGDTHVPEHSFFIRGGNNNNHTTIDEFDDHLFFLGDYEAAEKFFTRMIAYWQDRVNHPYATPMYSSYAMILYEWNRLEEAEDWINRIIRSDGFAPVSRNRYQIFVAASRIQQAKGNSSEAAALLEHIKLTIDSPDYDLFMRKLEAEQASLSVLQGDLEAARQWLLRRGTPHVDEVTMDQVYELVLLVRVMVACEQYDSTPALAERLYELLTKENRLRDRIRILILLSIMLYRQDQLEPALARLDLALRLAEPQGFIRSFLDEGPVMAELLSRHAEATSMSYSLRLLQAFDIQPSRPRVKIRSFGRLRVETADGTVIKWRTSKAEELMAYLVHHRGEAVSRDRILDDLWGDVDVDRAGGQFHTTAYYMRRSLGQIGLDGIVQHVEGSYSIDVSLLDCDLEEWDRLLAEGAQPGRSLSREYVTELARVYGNGYLAGSSYPWAEILRIRLEEEYVTMLVRLHEREVKEGRYEHAAELLRMALAHDSLNESIHEWLIRVLVLANDRVSAIKQYEELRVMLVEEFGMQPREEVSRLLDFTDKHNA